MICNACWKEQGIMSDLVWNGDNFFDFADHVMSHDNHELKNWAEGVLDSDVYINYRIQEASKPSAWARVIYDV